MKLATKSGINAAALAAFSVLLLSACEDPRRVSWSPDGASAAVLAGDGLRISDSEGNLGDAKPGVELVNWFPGDSSRLLAVEYEKVTTWEQIRALESPDDLKKVMNTANTMLVAARQNKGDWKGFEKAVGDLSFNREAVIYLRENKDKDMATTGENWNAIKTSVDVGVHRFCSYDVADKSLSNRKEIYRTLRDVKEVRLSPAGNALLLVSRPESSFDTAYTLSLVTLDGTSAVVSKACSTFPDWSADGNEFYYIDADLPTILPDSDLKRTALIGSLTAVTWEQREKGFIELGEKRKYASVYFNKNSRVRRLADQSLVFSSAPVEFPGTGPQIMRRQTLFQYRPGKSAMVSRMIPADEPEVGGDLMEFFEFNRSGSLVAIPSTREGTTVYDVQTGSSRRVDGGGFRWSKRLSFIPTWRGESELCVGMKPESATADTEVNEIILWNASDEHVRSISEKWPAAARKKFLEPN
jgi:hypothetical protein